LKQVPVFKKTKVTVSYNRKTGAQDMRVAVGGPIMFCVNIRTIQLNMNCMNC